ncbi:MAG TPA: dodecin family protein [Gemmatimonadales bacterium]|jgi:flavin-binding protein dodecin|nr:dodecin family protein [Gemmatimonadales bacterium]
MSIAKVIEISATSSRSFEDAITSGVSRAGKTVQEVKGAWIKSMKVDIENGKIVKYRVVMKVTFVLQE